MTLDLGKDHQAIQALARAQSHHPQWRKNDDTNLELGGKIGVARKLWGLWQLWRQNVINAASETGVEAIVDDDDVEEDYRTALLKWIQETNVRPKMSSGK